MCRSFRSILIVALSLLMAGTAPAFGGPRAYRDANGYFSFNPPKGWIKIELSSGTGATKVIFETPGRDAGIVMIVRPRRGTSETLEESQQKLLKSQRLHFPEGKFLMSETEIIGCRVSKMEIDIPGQIKQDFYIFMSDRLFFNINYFAADKKVFDQYLPEAFDALQSIKPRVYKN